MCFRHKTLTLAKQPQHKFLTLRHLCMLTLCVVLLGGCVPVPSAPAVAPPAQDQAQLLHQLAQLSVPDMALQVPEHHLDLHQTIDGITVTVHWAAVNEHSVLIGYTMRSEDGQRRVPQRVTLSVADGKPLETTKEIGVIEESPIIDIRLPPGEGIFIREFRRPPGTVDNRPLDLRLIVMMEELSAAQQTLGFPDPRELLPQHPAGQPQPQRGASQPRASGVITGPFTFDITIP